MPAVPPWRAARAALPVDRRRLALLLAVLLGATALPLAGPQLVRRFVDDAVGGRPLHTLLVIAVGYLIVTGAGRALSITASWLASGIAWSATNTLRERLAAHALSLDLAYHWQHPPGEMIERIDGDVTGLTEFLSEFVLDAVASALLLVGVLVLVWREDVRVGIVLLGMVIFGGAALAFAQRRVVPHATRLRDASGVVFGNLEERLVAVDDIRANGAGRHVIRRFLDDCSALLHADNAWHRTGGVVMAGTQFIFGLSTAVLVGTGVILARSGALTIGTVVLLYQYSQMVRRPIQQILGQAKQLQQAGAAATRIADLFGAQPSIVDRPGAQALPAGPLAVSLCGVTFAYDRGEPVLHDISIDLAPGRVLGLVGATGSGKTTIARLALRFVDPTRGAVMLGGVDLRDVARASLRASVRLVTQEVQLFEGTLRDNVTLFDDAVDEGTVRDALTQVGLGAWFAGLPGGLDTHVGVDGLGVSAGEAQLLALARLFAADPGLVVLDEPASRLDPATELMIGDATATLLTGRTAIVIAHRANSLSMVDDVAVLDHGRVVEFGPRAVLAADPTSAFSRHMTVVEVA